MCAAAAVPLLEVDVAIVGGGMVGASLAAALAGTGRRLILIESAPFGTAAQPSFDERTTALGNVSRRIFEGLAVWDSIAPEAAAIRNIHVSEAGRFGFARLAAHEQGVDAFGYVIANRCIGAAVVDYDQVAVVANVTADRAHGGNAYERFTPAGPLALLPRHDGGLAVIWACRPERART